jgi:hypothetical protein
LKHDLKAWQINDYLPVLATRIADGGDAIGIEQR